MLVNPESVWVLEFNLSRLRTIVSGLHFCLSFRAGFHLQVPCAIRIQGRWVDGFLVLFFFFPFLQGGGSV